MKCSDCKYLTEHDRCVGFPMDFHVSDPEKEFEGCDGYKKREEYG